MASVHGHRTPPTTARTSGTADRPAPATTSATCGTVNTTASARTSNDGNPSAGPIPIMVNCAVITTTKVEVQGTVRGGVPLGYVVTVANSGLGIARNVTVSDTLPTN